MLVPTIFLPFLRIFWFICINIQSDDTNIETHLSKTTETQNINNQGSNLEPLLLMLYLNDLSLILPSDCHLLYADDAKLFLPVKDRSDQLRLQGILDQFSSWCCNNCLELIIEKCVTITFSRLREPLIFDYKMNDKTIED